MLRRAGFPSKEANRLKTRPPEVIQFLVSVGYQPEQEATPPPTSTPIPEWTYEPFDKGYSQPFAYVVHYEAENEDTNEIFSDWVTFISDKEETYETLLKYTIAKVQTYGLLFIRITEIVAMKAGLPGGAR